MNRFLENGTEYTLGKENYVVCKLLERGPYCVLYLADHIADTGNVSKRLLKEYNPGFLDLVRDETGRLSVRSKSDAYLFKYGSEMFYDQTDTFPILFSYIDQREDAPFIHRTFYDKGTVYTDTSITDLIPYKDANDTSLCELMYHMKALTQIVGWYHSKGFIHLYIKPANIYIPKEKRNDIVLLNPDRLIRKKDICSRFRLPGGRQWAAAEQVLVNQRRYICEATDLFSIGELIFFMLYGRHSEMCERSIFPKLYTEQIMSRFDDVFADVIPLLLELFKKTICNSVKLRYQNAYELEAQIDKIIQCCKQ